MAICGKCGAEVTDRDLYYDNGIQVCEDCRIKRAVSPALPCGGEHNK